MGAGEEEGDMYMAGFKAGLKTSKEKKKDKGSEEREAFQETVKNGMCYFSIKNQLLL